MKLVLLAALCSLAMAAAKKPNFVVFFADDMGYSQPGAMSDRSPFAGDNGTISCVDLSSHFSPHSRCCCQRL